MRKINLVKNIVGIILAVFIVVMNMGFDKEISITLLVIPAMLLGIDVSGFFASFRGNTNSDKVVSSENDTNFDDYD